MVNQNKIFLFKIKRQAKNVFRCDIVDNTSVTRVLCALYDAILRVSFIVCRLPSKLVGRSPLQLRITYSLLPSKAVGWVGV